MRIDWCDYEGDDVLEALRTAPPVLGAWRTVGGVWCRTKRGGAEGIRIEAQPGETFKVVVRDPLGDIVHSTTHTSLGDAKHVGDVEAKNSGWVLAERAVWK